MGCRRRSERSRLLQSLGQAVAQPPEGRQGDEGLVESHMHLAQSAQ